MGLFSGKKVTGKRLPVMAGNWKMNETTAEAVTLSQRISYEEDKEWGEGAEVILCPPFTDLKSVWNVLAFDHSKIKLAAQDVFWEDSGAYTGAISPVMLKEIHCDYCIIGHSERRAYFGDTNETVNKKAKALIAKEIYPIMCCGESLETREAGETLDFVGTQVREGLDGIDAADIAKSIVAYEPIWAIGTGHTATPEQAQEVCAYIRAAIAQMAGTDTADSVRILYGGSMKPANAQLFLPLDDVDGGLIGGASLDAKSFAELVKMTLELS